jgi:uncharacterized protein
LSGSNSSEADGHSQDEAPALDADLPPEPDHDREPGPGPGAVSLTGRSGDVSAGGRPGAAIFTLEGRAAPGLYLVGWLASVLGLALLLAVLFTGPGGAGAIALALIAVVLLSVGLIAATGSQGIERRARGAAGYSGPSPFLVFLASLPVSVLGVVILLAPAGVVGIAPTSPAGTLLGQTIVVLVYVGVIQLLVVSPRALSWTEMGLRFGSVHRALGDLAWGAVLAVPVLFATGIVGSILVGLLHQAPDNPLPPSTGLSGLGLNLLTAAIIAPAGEEVFFRGFAATAWFRSIGWNGALIRSSLFFALVHVLNASGATFGEAATVALLGFLLRIPVGLALGWIFLRRGSLLASFGLHAVFNGIQVLVAYFGA